MRPEDRDRIQVEVISRVVGEHMERAQRSLEVYLETLINDTLYFERRRLDKEKSLTAKKERTFYASIRKRLCHASKKDMRELLEKLTQRFVSEIVGNFNQHVYRFSTSVIPVGLWGLLNALSPRRLLSLEGMKDGLADHVRIEGEVEHVKRLAEKGTLVVVPTHSSNLDSIILGYVNFLIGLPPLTCGAGLNLFSNPLISFFMRNLGAYKVDRKKTSVLYKDVLKEYATCSIEMGYHNLFFPGGTRSRSGAIEQKLKKGLLGTAIRAFVGNLKASRPKPDVYLIPCTLSYKLVLEASTLIADHLAEVGKARYIIEDDEFSKPRLIVTFLSKLLSMDSQIVITYCSPIDIFGNHVDEEGRSTDPRGRYIDHARYVMRAGEPIFDEQRDRQYTIEAADKIKKLFLKDNMVHSTHVVAYAIYRLLERKNPDLDLYRLLRTGGESSSFPMQEVHLEVSRVLGLLEGMDSGPRLGRVLKSSDIQAIVADALKAFSLYHTHPAAVRRGDRVFHEERNLLLYYGNRLRGYNLGRRLNKQICEGSIERGRS